MRTALQTFRCQLKGSTRAWLPALLLLVASCPVTADDHKFVVRSATSIVSGNVVRVDADVDFELSDTAREALESGVPLVLEIQIQVLRQRKWLWDRPAAEVLQRNRIQYHALSQRFVVVNLNTGVQGSYRYLSSALAAVGRLRDFPLLDRQLLRADTRYKARLRARLDIESLPTPMRLWAYTASSWRLSSPWYKWPLHH